MQDLAENMGLQSLNQRLQDPDCMMWFHGIFPKDTPRNMRFSINFFTSIGLGGLTDEMRAYLKVMALNCHFQVIIPFDISQMADAGATFGNDA